jgi:hypothetical protein
MQIKCPPPRPNVRAFALLTTVCIVAAALVVFASILAWSLNNAQVTQRNIQYNTSENAAEAAVEAVIGRMDRDFVNGILSSNGSAYTGIPATINQTNPAWPVQYTFSDTNGNPGMASVALTPTTQYPVSLNSEYAGLNGLVQSNDVWAMATPIGQPYTVPAMVHESLQFATIPVFQFAIFYNVNLEIAPGYPMTIAGAVFCNQSIWEGSSDATFSSTVTAVGTNCVAAADPFANNYSKSAGAVFQKSGQPVSHANPLVLPVGTNNNPQAAVAFLNLPPDPYRWGDSATYSSNGIIYPANEADLVISNWACGTNWGSYTPAGTNIVVYVQNQATGLKPLPYDFFIVSNGLKHSIYFVTGTNPVVSLTNNIVYASYTWLTNAVFGDWREGWNNGAAKTVQAVQIDVQLLNTWLTNQTVAVSGYNTDQTTEYNTGHHIGGLYVLNSVPMTYSQLPAVRLVHGGQLPNPGGSTYGLSVATPYPVYVWGDYNATNNGLSSLGQWGTNGATANTLPAAIMGDAITILSDGWSDSVTSKLPIPANTTVNAAMLEGIVQSNPAISGNYSGGVENFLRLVENWSKNQTQYLTYNGSIVVLFYSQWATNTWLPTGNYYNPPTRQWAFDLNFKVTSKLPPMIPDVRAMIRGNWYAHQ